MLLNAIFAQYLNYEPDIIFLTKEDVAVAERLLASMSAQEQKDALASVVRRLPFGNSVYNLCALSALFPLLHDAISRGRLAELLLTEG